jgi:hypothetical protein
MRTANGREGGEEEEDGVRMEAGYQCVVVAVVMFYIIYYRYFILYENVDSAGIDAVCNAQVHVRDLKTVY